MISIPRTDLILHPRDWRISFYKRGVVLSVTAQYSFAGDGSVVRNHIRIGLPVKEEPAP